MDERAGLTQYGKGLIVLAVATAAVGVVLHGFTLYGIAGWTAVVTSGVLVILTVWLVTILGCRWQAVGRDVTLRTRLAEQAREHLEEILYVSRLTVIDQLVSGLEHDLNQPLTAISVYNQTSQRLLRSGQTDVDRISVAMSHAVTECRRASEIVRRLRGVVRGQWPSPSTVQVNRLIGTVVDLLGNEARRHSVAIQTQLQDDLPTIQANSLQIEQVLFHLIKNAIEAVSETESSTRRVLISSRQSKGGRVEVSVMDTGQGIPEVHKEKIFTPFFTTKARGMGLGLSICRSILESHRGRVWMEQGARSGTTFTFTLPEH